MILLYIEHSHLFYHKLYPNYLFWVAFGWFYSICTYIGHNCTKIPPNGTTFNYSQIFIYYYIYTIRCIQKQIKKCKKYKIFEILGFSLEETRDLKDLELCWPPEGRFKKKNGSNPCIFLILGDKIYKRRSKSNHSVFEWAFQWLRETVASDRMNRHNSARREWTYRNTHSGGPADTDTLQFLAIPTVET